jgi:erythromycin esterase-like protein
LSHGFGKFEANRELVEWMRHYNAERAHQRKLQFYGFDSPTDVTTESPRQTLHFVLDYLSSVDEALGQEYRNRIDPLLGLDSAWENPAAALDPTQAIGRSPEATALRIETEELISELGVRRPELVAKSDESRYQEAVHYAVMARQLLNFHATLAQPSEKRQERLLGIRAAMMAENLAYIVSREQGRGNVLVFAHNSHLKRGKVQWQWGNEAVIWWRGGIFDLLFIEKMGSRLSHRTLIDPFPCEAMHGTRRVRIASSLCFPHQATILPEPPDHAIPQTGSMLVSPLPTAAAAQVC